MGEMLRNLDSDKPSAATINVLTQIWQRVLERSQIGPEDRFYDIGGTDPLADRLFVEIAGAFDRQLPTATICHAPTITALAALLEQSSLPLFSPLVKLKAGSGKTPILIAHGLGGRASFSELAKHIRTEHAIYGIQAKGVDGMEEPFERIEDMAAFYLEALSQLQSEGSIILIGYSFGGLIALEMAQRLSAEGKNIALLVLVDTYPHPRYLPLGQRLSLSAKRIKGHISDLTRKPLRTALSQVLSALKSRLPMARGGKPRALFEGAVRLSFAETIEHVKARDLLAMRRYRPRFYRGKMIFVRPEANSYLPTDPTAVWKNMAAEFQVHTVPGDHLGMVAEHFESLAAVLTACVAGASRG
jgi:thioesterase domain-containing protein